ncbi:MAG TPA: hypothetical protein DIU39_06535 [Flavobacteriales bacterium]|nr:hypothetical protein [Flavobacteriales bacterium]|tara:strand:- start:70 stop:393 length:324 start_codon:yes stop_codon:yes gene_type:complete
MPKILSFLLFLTISITGFSQDIVPERTTKFEIKVSHLKTQEQLDAVKSKVLNLPNVQNVSLSWNDYTLVFEVKEGGDYGNFDIPQLKNVLLSEGVEVDKINRTVVKE